MEEKLKMYFSKLSQSKHFSTKSLVLSIVALLEIFAIMLTYTDAWVETISAILITNKKDTYGEIEQSFYQIATLNNYSNSDADAIDFSEYFRKPGGMHLSPASSPNGRDMYFRNVGFLYEDDRYLDERVLWRKGTSDDKNTNHISISLTVANACYFAFAGTPTIKLGNTVVQDNLVRISVGIDDNPSTFKIFGMGATLNSETTDDGVIMNAKGDSGSAAIYSFADYTYNSSNGASQNYVIKTTENTTVTVNIWIEDPYSSYSDIYNGELLTVSNLKLIPYKKITAYAVTNNSLATTGGTVKINNGTAGVNATVIARPNELVTVQATPKSGYALDGWYEAQTGGTSVSSSAGYQFRVPIGSADIDYYARFGKATTIYFLDRGYGNTMYAYAYGVNTGTEYLGDWDNKTSMTFRKSTGLYSCSFITSETGRFGIIASDGESNQTADYIGTIGKTYLLDENGLSEFTKGNNRVFYCTDVGWGQMNFYTWKNSNNSAKTGWPGESMKVAYKNSTNQNVYYYMFEPGIYDRIIFNGGGKQTVNITMSTTQCRYYPLTTTDSEGHYNYGTW